MCYKREKWSLYTLLVYMFLYIQSNAYAAEYKIGIFEAGTSSIYTETLRATKIALKEMGWGDKIQFPEDAYISPGWEPEARKNWDSSAQKLLARKDLDLFFVLGTDATSIMLKHNTGEKPIVAGGVSDAVRSKFVLNEHDSGVDNFTIRIVPGRYARMFRIFHDEVNFQRLGLLYMDTDNGHKYANVADAELVAKERGFKIIPYKISSEQTPEQCLNALNHLIKEKVDAFFMPSLTCFEWKRFDVQKHLELLTKNRIPTFARQGSEDVRGGALMGFSTVDYSSRGRFLAERIIQALQGEKLRTLKMVDNAPPKIALNLYVAQEIGFDLSFDILGASDEIYQEITYPSDRLVK